MITLEQMFEVFANKQKLSLESYPKEVAEWLLKIEKTAFYTGIICALEVHADRIPDTTMDSIKKDLERYENQTISDILEKSRLATS